MRSIKGAWLSLTILAATTGCAGTHEARYVYQDGQFGVVGIPANTDRWPHHYRQQADALMAAHFPEGHEIVRAEEVVEGSRTLTLEGSGVVELLPQVPGELLKVGKLGRTTSRSQADTVKIKECRIIYKRAPRPTASSTFAERPALTPTEYVDPNAAERDRSSDTPEVAAGGSDPPESKTVKAEPSAPAA